MLEKLYYRTLTVKLEFTWYRVRTYRMKWQQPEQSASEAATILHLPRDILPISVCMCTSIDQYSSLFSTCSVVSVLNWEMIFFLFLCHNSMFACIFTSNALNWLCSNAVKKYGRLDLMLCETLLHRTKENWKFHRTIWWQQRSTTYRIHNYFYHFTNIVNYSARPTCYAVICRREFFEMTIIIWMHLLILNICWQWQRRPK